MYERITADCPRWLPRLALILMLALLAGCNGCSCDGDNGIWSHSDSDVSVSGIDNSSSSNIINTSSTDIGRTPPFMAFKEIRYELLPEHPKVGEIVEYRICLVPVDNLSKVSHPWIQQMRNDNPNFSIVGLKYDVQCVIGGGDGKRHFSGREFISILSQIRHNTSYTHGLLPDNDTGFYAECKNLTLDNQSDTLTVKMRFMNPGRYGAHATVRFDAVRYHGTSNEIRMNGADGVNSKYFIVGERQQ